MRDTTPMAGRQYVRYRSGVVRVIVKVVAALWAAALVVGPLVSVDKRYPPNWVRSFAVSGQSRSWRVQSLFSPADFGHPGGRPDLGFEFDTGNLTYTGAQTRLKWYRMEIMLPQELSIRMRPGAAGSPSACTVDTRSGTPTEGTTITRGEHFNHGVCDVFPWSRSATELVNRVTKGLYVVSWEDDSGVHAEVLPLSTAKWQ